MAFLKSSYYILLGILSLFVKNGFSYDASYRLSDNHIPKSYNLEMNINPSIVTYNGTVTIHFSTKNRTNSIRLHACPRFLTLKDITVNDKILCNVSHPSTQLEEITEIVTITCNDNIEASHENKITISYDGIYRPHLEYQPFSTMGLKLGSYRIAGKGQDFVASQFEPMFTRRAFPCFDEPQFKAEFNVTIVHPEHYITVFNTAAYSEKVVNGIMYSKFKKTPIMSPHLLALVVARFEIPKETVSTLEGPNSVENIYVLLNRSVNIGTLKTYGQDLLTALDNWMGISYEKLGIDKIDFVVLPFPYAGSQPSWGLISFHESDILDDGNNTSPELKQIIINNIAYQLASQWFDDYVTPDWWSNVWLKEAFAGYFQFLIADEVKSLQMERKRQFITEYIHPGLYSDSPYPFGQPLSSKDEDVFFPDHIAESLWNVNYQKGPCILRMIEGIIGKDNFKKGIQYYLTQNKYKNTNPNILLNNFQKYHNDSNHNLVKIMKEWIYKPGYPLVTVTLQEDGKTVKFQQDEYNNDGKNKTTWYIPITYTTGVEKKFDIKVKNFLHNKPLDIELKHKTWILVNLQQSGFYRVNYDKELWKRIIEVLKSKDMKEIPVFNRAQLIDDAFALAKKGIISYNISLELLEYIKQETEYEPWYTATTWIKETIFVLAHVKDDVYLKKFKNSAIDWIKQAFPNGINPKTHLQKLTKNLISELTTILNKTFKWGESDIIFEDYIAEQRNNGDDDIKDIVCRCLQLSSQYKSYYKILMDYIKKSTSTYERKQILSTLECVDNPYDLEKFLWETLSEKNHFSHKEVRLVYESVYRNINYGVMVYWRFLKERLNEILSRYKFLSLSELLLRATDRYMNEERLSELKEIIEEYQDLENMKLFGEILLKEKTMQLNLHREQIENIISFFP